VEPEIRLNKWPIPAILSVVESGMRRMSPRAGYQTFLGAAAMTSAKMWASAFGVFLSFGSAFSQPSAPGEARTVEVTMHGWVDYKTCHGQCAAVGDPYHYNVYPARDVNNAALSAIEALGFSFQTVGPAPNFRECTEKKRDFPELKQFWTDYRVLKDEVLSKWNITWQQLEIVPDKDTTYQLRIVGCYYTSHDGANVPFTQPEAARQQFGHVFQPLYNTTIQFVIKVDIQERAPKGSWEQVSTSISPKVFLDSVAGRIQKSAESTIRTQLPCDSRGQVIN
jgi:hypothetical protein